MKAFLGALAFVAAFAFAQEAAAYYGPGPMPAPPADYDCGD